MTLQGLLERKRGPGLPDLLNAQHYSAHFCFCYHLWMPTVPCNKQMLAGNYRSCVLVQKLYRAGYGIDSSKTKMSTLILQPEKPVCLEKLSREYFLGVQSSEHLSPPPLTHFRQLPGEVQCLFF